MKKFAVFASGEGTGLQALIDSEVGNAIALVVSNKPECNALNRAKKAGIDTYIISDDILEVLTKYDIYLIVLSGYMKVVTDDIINAYKDRIINIHPSLIPSFCGMGMYGRRVHEAALAKGVKVSGATVHMVTSEVDGGKILAQKAVEVKEDDTPETLGHRIQEEVEWVIMPEVVKQIITSD